MTDNLRALWCDRTYSGRELTTRLNISGDMGYTTGIDALRLHGYDWHMGRIRSDRYLENVKRWSDFGIEDNVATPVRAYLDMIYHYIVNLNILPPVKLEEFTFTEEEEREIMEKLDSHLKKVLKKGEQKRLLKEWIEYNSGKIAYNWVEYGRRLEELAREVTSEWITIYKTTGKNPVFS